MNPDTYMQKDSEMRGMLSVHCLFVMLMYNPLY